MKDDDDFQLRRRYNVIKEFAAGGISGIAGLAIGHPFETIKTIMQNSNINSSIGVTKMIREAQSNVALFRGLSAPLATYFIVNALAFGTFKPIQNRLDPTGNDLSAICIAGSCAGTIQLIVTVPTELVKIRMQVTAVKHESMNRNGRQLIHKIIIKDGFIKGMYRGALITGLRDIPAYATYFATFYQSRDVFFHLFNYNYFTSAFLAGGVAGIACWVVTYPLDIIKTRIQSGKNDKIRECIRSLRPLGLSVYFTGIRIVCARAAVVNAVIFVVYDWSIDILNKMTGFY